MKYTYAIMRQLALPLAMLAVILSAGCCVTAQSREADDGSGKTGLYEPIERNRELRWSLTGNQEDVRSIQESSDAFRQLTVSRAWLRSNNPEYSRPSLISVEEAALGVVLAEVLGETTLSVVYGDPVADPEMTATFSYHPDIRDCPVCTLLDYVCGQYGCVWEIGPGCVCVAKNQALMPSPLITLTYKLDEFTTDGKSHKLPADMDAIGIQWVMSQMGATTALEGIEIVRGGEGGFKVRASSLYHLMLQQRLSGILLTYQR